MKRNLTTLLTQTVKRVPSSGVTNSHQTVVDGSPVPETDSTSLSKENLRSRVYTLMRDVAKVPFGLSTESLLIPSLMICIAANTWLDSGKELYVD
jgi:hypothetical protein